MSHEVPTILEAHETRIYSLEKAIEDGDVVQYTDLNDYVRNELEYLLDDWSQGRDIFSLAERMDTLLNTYKGEPGPKGDRGPQGERGPAGSMPSVVLDQFHDFRDEAKMQLAEARKELDALEDQRNAFKAEIDEMKELLKDFQEQINDIIEYM